MSCPSLTVSFPTTNNFYFNHDVTTELPDAKCLDLGDIKVEPNDLLYENSDGDGRQRKIEKTPKNLPPRKTKDEASTRKMQEDNDKDEIETKNESKLPANGIQCFSCGITLEDNLAFALHSIKHNDKKYSCHLCDYTKASKYSMEVHIRMHETETDYKCETCSETFTNKTDAVEHKNYHTGEKPFLCETCGKHFMFSRLLASHRKAQHWDLKTGEPPKKYDCFECNKHYTTLPGLKSHRKKFHWRNEEALLCDICGKSYSSREKLNLHRRIHTGYKPHACGVCSKSFTKKEQLKEHERVHTGERPFICKFCGKGFTQRTPLKVHTRIHTGEKPYVCRLCNKGFISKGTMDSHTKSCADYLAGS